MKKKIKLTVCSYFTQLFALPQYEFIYQCSLLHLTDGSIKIQSERTDMYNDVYSYINRKYRGTTKDRKQNYCRNV